MINRSATHSDKKRYSLRSFSSDEALIQERRDHIIHCSTRLFTKKGYSTTNMRELAKACKVSTGTLYNYFGSKEEILYSILDGAVHRLAKSLEESAKRLVNASATDALVQLIKEHQQHHDVNQDVTVFAYQETKNLPQHARDDIFDSEHRILTVFEKVLRRGVVSGEFHVNSSKLMAHNIMMLAHAWAIRRWLLREYWTSETYLDEQTELILKAISAKKAYLQ